MEGRGSEIGWLDYLLFACTLMISVSIGIYHGFFGGGKQKTTKEYLLADRKMGAFPVSLSLVCSAISAITLLANPVEVYLYSTQYMMLVLSLIPFSLSLAYLYIPVYFRLNVNSAYEVVSMSIAVYAPSLAIEAMTGIDTKISTAVIYFVCIFYSALGGLKAVLWTDVFQAFIMLASLLIIVIKGVSDLGGFSFVWQTASNADRIRFFNWDPDTRTRHTVWTSVVGGYFYWLPTYACTQIQIQRFLSMPNIATARRSLIYNMIGLTVIVLLCCFAGLVIFAKYVDCDPVANKDISKTDQLLPLFVFDTMGNIDGLIGIFIGGLVCASMSTLSSGLSALTSIVTFDFISKLLPNLSDAKLSKLSKINCFLLGLLSYSFVFVVENMGSILPATSSIIGIFVGPILGLFSCGMFFPSSNSKGALTGMILAFSLMIAFTIGNQIASNKGMLPDQRLPLSTSGCSNSTSVSSITSTTMANFDDRNLNSHEWWTKQQQRREDWKDNDDSFLIQLLSVSYLWYSAMGFVLSVVLGIISSAVVNINRRPPRVSPKFISPPILWIWRRFAPNLSKRWLIPEQTQR